MVMKDHLRAKEQWRTEFVVSAGMTRTAHLGLHLAVLLDTAEAEFRF